MKSSNFADHMTQQGQGSATYGYFDKFVIHKAKPDSFSTGSYDQFFADSLNPAGLNPAPTPELRKVIRPVQKNDTAAAGPVYSMPSLFTEKQVGQLQINPVKRNYNSYDWLTGLFLICLIVFAWIRYNNMRRIKQLFRAVIAQHNVNQLVRDGNLAQERLTPGLALIYLSSLSSLIFLAGGTEINSKLGVEHPLTLFLIIFGLMALLWLIKILFIRGTGIIFRSKQESGELILTNLIFNSALGLTLFPIVVTGFYSNHDFILKVAVVILLAGMSMRFLRSMIVGIAAQTFSVLYLFLYLCTLEILPVLFLYRLVTYTG